MREKLVRLGLIACLVVPTSLLASCEKEDVQDLREGTNEVENELDKAEDKIDKEIGDNDKGKD